MTRKSIAALLLFALFLTSAAFAVEVETVNVTPVTLSVSDNHAPVAENLQLETYRGVSVGGDFRAVDPDGDVLSYRIVSEPFKGSVTTDGSTFIYTPADGKRGRDTFTYVAADEQGCISSEATITVEIRKQNSKVCYADLRGSALDYAAVRLAEEGIFTGERIGESWCFSPDGKITRGEFLAICAAMTELPPLEDVTRTGFSDDSGILAWQKPYVSAALLYGVIRGSTDSDGEVVFRSSDTITRAEAAVMLNNFLEISDAVTTCRDDALPDWAAQAVMNLDACNICSASNFESSGSLNRGEAALLISAALDVLKARNGTSFRWSA